MNNYELFFSSFTELISILILFNAFNKNLDNKFIKSFIIILLSSVVVVATNSFASWIGTLINFAFLVFILTLFYKKNMRSLIIEYTFIMIFIMVMELIVDRILIVFVFREINSEFLNYIFANTVMIILCICIYFCITDKFMFDIYKRILEIYNKYNPIILNLIDEIKRRQHDFKNHFTTIYGMVLTYDEKELKNELKNYLESLQNSLSDIEEYIYMGNRVFAAIIYVKVREAKQKNIKFSFDIEDNTIKFPLRGYELSEVLNNLIDNAFEAVMNMELDKKMYI